MIDLSLSELMLIGVVALIVLGPEKLPGVARMAGSVFGRAQRYIYQLRHEVSNELALNDLHALREEVRDTANEVGKTLSDRTLFSGSTHEAEERDPMEELAAAKAKIFRSHKAERRAFFGTRNNKNQHMRKKLRSTAAQHVRNQFSNATDRGAK